MAGAQMSMRKGLGLRLRSLSNSKGLSLFVIQGSRQVLDFEPFSESFAPCLPFLDIYAYNFALFSHYSIQSIGLNTHCYTSLVSSGKL